MGSRQKSELSVVKYRGIDIQLSRQQNRWKSTFQIPGRNPWECYRPKRSDAKEAAEAAIASEIDGTPVPIGRVDEPVKKERKDARYLWFALGGGVILLMCCVVSFLVGVTPSSNPYDYPFTVITAGRILGGETPYVDYSVVYGPLGYYLNAAGIGILSFLPLVPAFNCFYVICTILYLGALGWKLLRLLPDHLFAFCALTLYSVLLTPIFAHYAYYSMLPVGMLILAIHFSRKLFAVHLELLQKLWPILFLSVLATVSFLGRINFGAYIIFGVCVVGLCTLLAQRGKNWKSMGAFAVFTGGSMLIAAGILYSMGILVPYVQDLIQFLPRYRARALPLPYDSIQLFLLTVILVLLAIFLFYLAWRKHFGAGLFGIILTVCLFHYSLQRFDLEHAYPLLLLLPFVYLAVEVDSKDGVGVFSSYGLAEYPSRFSMLSIWSRRLALGFMLLIAISYMDRTNQLMGMTTSYWAFNFKNHRSFLDDSVLIYPNESAMLRELAASPDGNSEIFWGSLPGCCESSTQTGANLGLYLAQNRLPTAKYWYFDPCSTAHADVQQLMIKDLEAKQFKRIAMQGLIDPTANYLPGNPPESRLLYDYVLDNYTFSKRYVMPEANRYYDIYLRKAAP